MSIRTKLRLSAAVTVGLALAVTFTVSLQYRNVSQAARTERFAQGVIKDVSDLNSLNYEYLLLKDKRPGAQWQLKHASLGRVLSEHVTASVEEQRLLARLRSNHEQLKRLFDAVSERVVKGPAGAETSPSQYDELSEGITAQLMARAEMMASDASLLGRESARHMDAVQQTSLILVLASAFVLIVSASATASLLARSIGGSIRVLEQGTQRIAAGDLEYRLGLPVNDELGKLARSFDSMTERLQTVTVSKDRLQQEVEERQRAEIALKESEQRWATTLASIGDAVIATDVEGRIAFMNAVAEGLTGWTLADASMKPVTEVFNIINEQTRKSVENPVTKVLREGMIVGLANHTVLIRKDGKEVPIDDSGAPIRDADGNTTGVVLVFRDITDRKGAEEALRQQAEEFQHLLDMVPAAVWVARDPECLTIIGNRRADQFYEAGSGENVSATALPDARQFFDRNGRELAARELPMQLSTATNQEVRDSELNVRLSSGRKITILGSAIPLRDANGDVRGCIGTFIDITDRKRMEEELRKSEARWNAVIESLREGVIIATEAGEVIYWNPAAQVMHGFTKPGEGIGPLKETPNTFDLIIPNTDRVLPLEEWPMPRIMRGESVRNFELRLRRPDQGWERIVSYSGAMVETASGERLVFLSVYDLTERKRAEEALQKAHDELELRVQERTESLRRQTEALSTSEKEFRLLAEAMPQIVWITRADGWNIYFNQQWVDYTGLTLEESYGHGWNKPFHPDDQQRAWDAWQNAVTNNGTYSLECRLRATDGTYRWWLVRGVPVIDEKGTISKWFGTCTDIEEIKRTEEAVRVASAYNRNLIEASIDPLVTINPEGRISDVNAATEQATGYSRDELIGTDFSDYFTDPQKARAGYQMVFDKGLVRDYPLEIRHRDGHITPVLYNASVYRDDSGSVIGVFAAARDVSEQQKLEVQLRQAQKMEALGTLSGGIAHDFNNILAAIVGFTELLSGNIAKGSRDAHRIERIMEAAIRGRELVQQMLTFSRKTEQEKKPLRVSTIVKETVKLIRATTPTTISIKVNTVSESDLILGDPTQIQQVLMNLCTNAAHAMREKGGSLDIDLTDFSVSASNGNPDGIKPGLYVKLTVRDTGAGISPDIMNKIFDPFFTTKKLGEGTGLGLSVVHGIVKQSNGHITAESELGKGSTFTLYFPKIMGELQTDVVSHDEIPTGSERILFVDDEEALVEMGEDILAELGYDVTSRMSSREALALLKLDPSRFDLVITDQTMPDMTGIDLANEILDLRADMPIIMCTGFSYVVDADKAKAAGIKAFAMKPLTKREIAKTIRRVLDEHTSA
jgi:PAS domain S-box-containing protein